MAVQLVEDRLITVFKDQVKFPFSPEHFDQIHQVGVLQLLHKAQNTDISVRIKLVNPADRGVFIVSSGGLLSSYSKWELINMLLPLTTCPVYELLHGVLCMTN